MSSKKWLAKAKGRLIIGFGIFETITAPTIACGVSSTVIAMIYLASLACQICPWF